MKKILLTGLPLAVLLCGFGLKSLLPAKDITLNHIAFHVTDLAKSTAFYENIVGLDSVPEPFHDGKHTWLKIGPTANLHLISGAEKGMQRDKFSHLCLSVPSLSDFIKKLDNEHIPYEDWPGAKISVTLRVDGVKQIYFQDPDGYWLEVNDDRK